ncbi:MAG: hypothetical protein PHI11_02360 [Gallionella sp.]|nr:hypothetical protein [Gallionella sp.]
MNTRNPQKGFVLLEGLIAILIFSMAILGVVGMQATAITMGTESQYRADAAFLANQLLAQMWAHAGAGVYVNGSIITAQAASAAGIDVAHTAAAPNLYNYHCMTCTVAEANTVTNKTGDPEFVRWLLSIQGGFLPGVSDTTNSPDINVHCSTADGGASYPTCPAISATQVTVTLRWQRNNRAGTPQHQYQTLSSIEPN